MSGKDWVSACLARRARGGVVTVRDESGGQHEVGAADMPDRFFFGLCPACHKAGPRHYDDKRAYSATTEDSIKTLFLMGVRAQFLHLHPKWGCLSAKILRLMVLQWQVLLLFTNQPANEGFTAKHTNLGHGAEIITSKYG